MIKLEDLLAFVGARCLGCLALVVGHSDYSLGTSDVSRDIAGLAFRTSWSLDGGFDCSHRVTVA